MYISIKRPFYLPAGNYKIELIKEQSTDPYSMPIYQIDVNWRYEVEDLNKLAGGLRIKKVIAYDPITDKKLIKTFQYTNAKGISTGSLIGVPQYGYHYKEDFYSLDSDNYLYLLQSFYYVRRSSSTIPLGSTQGNHVGYGEVTVYYDDAGNNGKTTYTYTSPLNFPDVYDLYYGKGGINSNNSKLLFPYAPVDSRDWLRGLPLKILEYRKEGNSYFKVKSTTNTYNIYEDTEYKSGATSNLLGVKADYSTRYINSPTQAQRKGVLQVSYFRTRIGYHELSSTVDSIYNQNDISKSVVTRASYTYSPNHFQQTKTVKSTSLSNKSLVTQTAYPADYTDASGFIKDLQTNHVHNVPVESVTYQQDAAGNNQQILSGVINLYKPGGKGLLDASYALETNSPIDLINFKFSNQSKGVLPSSTNKTIFEKDLGYVKKVQFKDYDTSSNIQQLQKVGDIPISYLWGYDQTRPIAKIENAAVNEIFYTSFEEEGNTSESKTGLKSLKGGYTRTVSNLSNGKYILSYWENTTSGWQFQTNPVTVSNSTSTINPNGSFTINITQQTMPIDELRFYPAAAKMITYTYKPLVGVSAIADVNSNVTYYEYDSLGRLLVIKDDQGNIIKRYDYNYQLP